MTEIRLRTGAWYRDAQIELPVPPGWEIEYRRPATPAPLSAAEIESALARPVGQRPLRELAAGRQRPVIILDDLTRPTPAGAALPFMLAELAAAGIPAGQVTLLLGGGMHRPAPPASVRLKAGAAADGCRLAVHDPRRGTRIGKTSFGTVVSVDPEVARADLVLGIGGVYPQHSVGFGGGSKLLLGVLSRRSIVGLHYGHSSVGGTYSTENDFRRDLDQMARMAGLAWTASLHVDADREVVRAVSGDPLAYHAEAAAFSRRAYAAELPGDADVVIANAYPMDVSLTFARSKGLAPLYHERRGASRVLVAGCPEGLGYHGLFPYLNGPRFETQLHQLRRLSVLRPRSLPAKVARRVRGRLLRGSPSGPPAALPEAAEPRPPGLPRRPLRLFAPGLVPGDLPAGIPGVQTSSDWAEVVRAIAAEQPSAAGLRVAVYTCAPLQCLEFTGSEDTAFLAHATA